MGGIVLGTLVEDARRCRRDAIDWGMDELMGEGEIKQQKHPHAQQIRLLP